MSSNLDLLKQRLYDMNAIGTACSIMSWDQQTYMPPKSGEARAEHLSILSRMSHEMFIAPETWNLIEKASPEAQTEEDQALIRIVKRGYEISTKLPTKLVEEKSKLSAQAHEAWVTARANSDFASFEPILTRMFEIVKEEAECIGYTDHIYDALIDLYEEGATHADCTRMFETLKQPLVKLIQQIKEADPIDDNALFGEWDKEKQRLFTEEIVEGIGFDMSRGRQDVAPHPFCTNFSINDVRLTTRYLPYLPSSIFSSLHEAGHGMYEQNSPQAWDRLPISGGVSLGVHESQSRTWENLVGRSKPFWTHYLPKLQNFFPELNSFNTESFYQMINKVEPGYVRVEADELTYNLHVMLRFEIESEILTGKLAVKNLPDAWNAKMTAYLGVTPPNDALGCLQDVHWSGGSIGYFPTYSMGNLLSYQFWACLQRDIPNTDELMASGNFAPILNWLREKIYLKGSKYQPKTLVEQVSGKPIGADDYLAGITKKYREIYRLDKAGVGA